MQVFLKSLKPEYITLVFPCRKRYFKKPVLQKAWFKCIRFNFVERVYDVTKWNFWNLFRNWSIHANEARYSKQWLPHNQKITSSSSSKNETSCIQPKRFMSHFIFFGAHFTRFPYFRVHTWQNGAWSWSKSDRVAWEKLEYYLFLFI